MYSITPCSTFASALCSSRKLNVVEFKPYKILVTLSMLVPLDLKYAKNIMKRMVIRVIIRKMFLTKYGHL